MRHLPCRIPVALLGGSLLALLVASPAQAACGPLDIQACTDAVEYRLWEGIAGLFWGINRMLLMLAYQLDQLRAWVISSVFESAWNGLTGLVTPLLIPIATVALTLGMVLLLVMPLTGRLNIVTIRHVLLWALLSPAVLLIAGPLLADLDTARVQVGNDLITQAGLTTPGAIFGARAEDMAAPAPLYPSNPCGTGTLARAAGGSGIHLDELAASIMYANAQDIHCPDAAGPFRELPDGFNTAPPGYAYAGDVATLETPVERRQYIDGIRQGTVRLALGLVPSLLAVVAELVNLLFSLALVILFIGIPLNLLFVYFQQTSVGITTVFRRSIGILQTSWTTSFVLGMVATALSAAAQTGSATGYIAFAGGSLVLVGYLALVALRTLVESLHTLSAAVQGSMGVNPSDAAGMVGTLGLAAVTGGTSAAVTAGATALTGMAAMQQTGSARYATAAMAGRASGTLGRLGETALALGVGDAEGEVARGLHAGRLAREDYVPGRDTTRRTRLQMERDGGAPRDTATRPSPPTAPPMETPSDDAAMQLGPDGRMRYAPRRDGADIPPHAQTVPSQDVFTPRMWRAGYVTQQNPNATTTFWKAQSVADSAAFAAQSPAAQQTAQDAERRDLIAQGILADREAREQAAAPPSPDDAPPIVIDLPETPPAPAAPAPTATVVVDSAAAPPAADAGGAAPAPRVVVDAPRRPAAAPAPASTAPASTAPVVMEYVDGAWQIVGEDAEQPAGDATPRVAPAPSVAPAMPPPAPALDHRDLTTQVMPLDDDASDEDEPDERDERSEREAR